MWKFVKILKNHLKCVKNCRNENVRKIVKNVRKWAEMGKNVWKMCENENAQEWVFYNYSVLTRSSYYSLFSSCKLILYFGLQWSFCLVFLLYPYWWPLSFDSGVIGSRTISCVWAKSFPPPRKALFGMWCFQQNCFKKIFRC